LLKKVRNILGLLYHKKEMVNKLGDKQSENDQLTMNFFELYGEARVVI